MSSTTISQNPDFLISYQRNLLKNLPNNATVAAVAAMAAATYGANLYSPHHQGLMHQQQPIIGFDYLNPGYADHKQKAQIHIPV